MNALGRKEDQNGGRKLAQLHVRFLTRWKKHTNQNHNMDAVIYVSCTHLTVSLGI